MPSRLPWTRLFILFCLVFFSLATAAAPASASKGVPDGPPIPDGDHEVVPGRLLSASVLLPDLQTLPPEDIELEVIEDPAKVRLRFANTIWNSGPGDLELRGSLIPGFDAVLVVQALKEPGGQSVLQESGIFAYHEEHGHWHWEDFSIYQVWSVSARGWPLRVVASSDKIGYCLIDVQRFDGSDKADQNAPDFRQFGDCNWYLQGLSSGWTDTYEAHIAGQFVDITGLADGTYALISTVDPDDMIIETDNLNNSTTVYFTLMNGELEVNGTVFIPDESDWPMR